MAFEHCTEPFGHYEKYRFWDSDTDCSFSLVPGHGACILDLVFHRQNIIDGYQKPEEMVINRWAKNVILYPFPNRMRNGRYQWRGEYFFFPINDTATNTALHGFGMNRPMQVTGIKCTDDEAIVTCEHKDPGRHQAYPFLFTIRITFHFSAKGTLDVEMEYSNDGAMTIPVGFGWHPYFQLADKVDTFELQMPECKLIGIDKQMIPTGKRYDFDDFAQLKKIGTAILDNCFALNPSEAGKAELLLRGEWGTLRYWQETGPGKFNFMQVFTPPHRQSLAIEPMTCNIDAFNNEEGLIVLEPGETASARFGYVFNKA